MGPNGDLGPNVGPNLGPNGIQKEPIGASVRLILGKSGLSKWYFLSFSNPESGPFWASVSG